MDTCIYVTSKLQCDGEYGECINENEATNICVEEKRPDDSRQH